MIFTQYSTLKFLFVFLNLESELISSFNNELQITEQKQDSYRTSFHQHSKSRDEFSHQLFNTYSMVRIFGILSLIGMIFLGGQIAYNMYDTDQWSVKSTLLLLISIVGYIIYVFTTKIGKRPIKRLIHHWTLLGLVNIICILLLTIDIYEHFAQLDIWDLLLQSGNYLHYYGRNLLFTILFYLPAATLILCSLYTYQMSVFYQMWLKRKGWSSRLWDEDPRLAQLNQVLKSDNNWLNKEEEEFVQKSLNKQNRNKGVARVTIIVMAIVLIQLTNISITIRMMQEVETGKSRGKNLRVIALAPVKASERSKLIRALDFTKTIIQKDLPAVDLQHALLNQTEMEGINLQKTNFSHAKLWKASFEGSNLQQAQFKKANLERARFGNANLRNTNLSGARLYKANLWKANLAQANLTHTDLRGAILLGATGLQTAVLDSFLVSDNRWFELQTQWKTGLQLNDFDMTEKVDQTKYNNLVKKGLIKSQARELASYYLVTRKRNSKVSQTPSNN
ncbi:hypothetical protein BKI52_25390 [marine bacterium AO1-C]|nr:hypothetical protein BKI52_25390 [marine bacterium AO1-C]